MAAGLFAVLGVVLLGIGLTRAGPSTPPVGPDVETAAPAPSSSSGMDAGPAPERSSAASGEAATPDATPVSPQLGSVAPMPRSVPVRLDIPAIGVRTRVSSLGLQPDGTVEVPSLGRNSPAGWYKYLATPGELGPAVILGHVDSARDGPAVFYRLGRLRRGDSVSVTRADGSTAVFAVRAISQVTKSQFPTMAVYGPTRSAELRLVTCGGSFDRRRLSYRDSVIVFATLQTAIRRRS